MDTFRDTSRRNIIILILFIILLQLFTSTYFMATQKNGYYADDMYSYGFANSPGTFTPLEVNGEVDGELNINQWMSGDVLKDFLTVSEEERFSFDRVANTLKRDAHPPLYYYLLHMICSFFPGVFSQWFAFGINAVGFIILQIYLYRLTLLISHNRFFAILTMSFFGFTSAAINIICLLRMYMLATAFTVAFTFYVMKYTLDSPEEGFKNKNLLPACLSLYLAAMTAYICVIFAFLLTLCMCCILLLKKAIKKMLFLGFSLFLSVALMIASFPPFIDQISSDQIAMQGAELYPYMLQVRTCIHVIFKGLFALSTPIFPSMIPFYICTFLIAITILYLIVFFLFRNDEWFRTFNKKTALWFKNILKKCIPYLFTLLPIIICCSLIILYCSKTLQIYYYKYLSMRYLFILTPFIAITLLVILFKSVRSKYICIIITLAITYLSIAYGDKCYLETEYRSADISSVTEDSDVILVSTQSAMFMNHIMDILKCRNYMYTNVKSVAEKKPGNNVAKKAESSGNMILLIDVDATSTSPVRTKVLDADGKEYLTKNVDNEVLRYFQSLSCFDEICFLGCYHDCYLYRLK